MRPAQSSTGQSFDVKAAVDAYLAKMPPAQRARIARLQADHEFQVPSHPGFQLVGDDKQLALLQ
jgi:hypothetical protein